MCDQKLLQYNIVTSNYQSRLEIEIEHWCNGMVIKNDGTVNCFFNTEPIVPGESKSIGGNRLEIYRGRATLSFATGGIASAWVTQKFYTNIDTCNGKLEIENIL
jgi:hypothetical protein